MYRRYQAAPPKSVCNNKTKEPTSAKDDGDNISRKPETKILKEEHFADNKKDNKSKVSGFLTKFIPQSLYNPQTGKIFGILSADDLFLVALIILLIDSGDEDEDNSMLVYALLYILLSEHIDLPF